MGIQNLIATFGRGACNSGLVFSGSNEGNFFALDADNGKPLWDFNVGGAIRANPISYAVDGKQFVMISAGTTMFVFALP
jgi:alcohol dehydrogenase (cytochrome c)